MRNFYIVALPSAIFCYDVQRALIAQLDRVQVSEACGVGSSPAERTTIFSQIISKLFQYNNFLIELIITSSDAFSIITV